MKKWIILIGLAATAPLCVGSEQSETAPSAAEVEAAFILAEKIAESAGGDPSRYLSYACGLVRTLKQFDSGQREEAMGYDPIPNVPGGNDSATESSPVEAPAGWNWKDFWDDLFENLGWG